MNIMIIIYYIVFYEKIYKVKLHFNNLKLYNSLLHYILILNGLSQLLFNLNRKKEKA